MTIHLPNDVESGILAAVHSGRFASLDAAMTEAASMLMQRLKQEQAQSPAHQNPPPASEQPIWARILEMTADVPDDEWDKLPRDLAEQHDHYIYGVPKRPTA